MANPTRVLFISGEVAPFAKYSELADIVRLLPEKLQETNEYELRIMMPRYTSISERRNRLHEVIRLSGSEVGMAGERETLKVKVASIPGIRLQVYFMDNNRYFKRKAGAEKQRPEDVAQRALFFGRASLQTIKNLGWAPDVVHAFGAMSTLVPGLLRCEYAADALFQQARIVFTPEAADGDGPLSAEAAAAFSVSETLTLNEAAAQYADMVLYPPFLDGAPEGSAQLTAGAEEMLRQASSVYDQVLSNAIAA